MQKQSIPANQIPVLLRPRQLLWMGVLLPLLHPHEAYAYLGPGGAVSAVGTLIAILAAILIAIVGFVWFPLRRLMRRSRNANKDDSIAITNTPLPTDQPDSLNE